MSRPKRDLRSNALGDAEAMLSLLSEGMVEEFGVVREKKWIAFPEGGVGSKQNAVIGKLKDRKPNLGSGYRVSDPKTHQLESYRVPPREEGPKRDKEREDVPKDEDRRSRWREPRIIQSVEIEKFKDRKQNVDSQYWESELKNHELETYRVPSREEGCKREEEKEIHSKNEDQRSRTRESSSSYFSLSDSEDYDSDVEAKLNQEHFVGESLVSDKKDSRKSGGVVITEKNEKDWEKCRDEKQVLQKNARNDVRVSGSIQRDWRKKSEKKLTEESDVKSFGQSRSQFVKDNRASMYSKSNSQHVHSKETSRDDVETSSYWKRTSQGKDSKIAGKFQEAGCDYCETCGRSMEEKKTQSYIQHHADRSETSIGAELTVSGERVSENNRHRKHGKSSSSIQSSAAEEIKQHGQIHIVTGQSDTKRDSLHYQDGDQISANDSCTKSNLRAPQQSEAGLRRLVEKSRTAAGNQPGIRLKEEGKSSSSLQNSAMEKNKEIDELYLATSQVDTRKKSQHHSENLGSDVSYLQGSERLQHQEETLKKQEENRDTSLVAIEELEEVKRLRKESSGKMTKDVGSSNVFHTNIVESRTHSSNSEINSQSTSDKHLHNEDTYSKLKLKSVEEIVEKRKWIDETVVQSTHRTEVQRSSTEHFSEEATITQPSVPSNSQTETQQSSGEEVMSGQLLVTSPPYRHVSRVSQFPEVSSSVVRNDMGRAARGGSDSTPEHAQASSPSSYGELNLSRKKSTYSPEHTLVSATHMQESSSLFVGEFVEKMSHETSTSDTAVEKESSNTDPKHVDKNYMLKRSTQLDPEDALNSAAHMQESSSLIFGDFSEKMSQEASKSETNIEKRVSTVNTKIQSKNSMTQGSSQLDAGKIGSQKHVSDYSFVVSGPDLGKTMSHKLNSKRSSGDSETNEPLDQMWDVKDHFVQESPEIEALEGATSESIVHARTGKSLWNTVTGALRLRWGSHSENQTSPVKRQSSPSESKKSPVKRQSSPSESKKSPVKRQSSSSESQKSPVKRQSSPSESQKSPVKKQSSPSRSGSGETWSPVKRQSSSSQSQKSPVKRQSSPSESQKSPVKRQSSPSSGETWFSENEADNGEGMKTEEISLLQESSFRQSLLGTTKSRKDDVLVMSLDGQSSHVDVGALSSSIQSSSPSGVAFAGENISLNVAQQVSDPSALVDLSTPSRRLRRSFAFEEDDGAEKTEAPTSSSDEQRDSLIDVRQTDDSASGETDVELKRRKLQRSKVIIQRYDDWEDAYRREREQRKVDEIFMREALSEAIKAADSWEVPVGAVLVQNGKIIARGYNLVEELRDSTAHAEMLCIKEASNILRTWRLSETTLYVTLEPCPMCAGAILQARISTLVWGAPNKLLGADGSWIRLFPAGVEGEENSEAADKPAAPVHPFHPNMKIRRGILEDECADIMQQFFQLRRRKAKEKKAETSSSEESVQPSCFPKPHQRPRLLHKMHNVFHPSKQRND